MSANVERTATERAHAMFVSLQLAGYIGGEAAEQDWFELDGDAKRAMIAAVRAADGEGCPDGCECHLHWIG